MFSCSKAHVFTIGECAVCERDKAIEQLTIAKELLYTAWQATDATLQMEGVTYGDPALMDKIETFLGICYGCENRWPLGDDGLHHYTDSTLRPPPAIPCTKSRS